jgi:hypothetical protein
MKEVSSHSCKRVFQRDNDGSERVGRPKLIRSRSVRTNVTHCRVTQAPVLRGRRYARAGRKYVGGYFQVRNADALVAIMTIATFNRDRRFKHTDPPPSTIDGTREAATRWAKKLL